MSVIRDKKRLLNSRGWIHGWLAAPAFSLVALIRAGDAARSYFRTGVERAKAQDWKGAAVAYKAAIAKDATRASWHFRLGIALSKLGKWEAAASAFEAALARREDKAHWFSHVGFVRAKMRDWAGAASAYEAAIARKGNVARWYFRLGVARMRLGDWAAAADAYQAAVSRDDQNGSWYRLLGLCREKTREWEAAADAYQAAIDRSDRNPGWYRHIGLCREKARDWLGAAGAYRAALDLQPSDDSLRCRLAQCMARSGDEDAALDLVAPFIAESDTRLAEFLIQNTKVNDLLEATVLFTSSAKSRPARRITITSGSRTETYFEHCRDRDGASCYVHGFYEAVARTCGDAFPDFVPRLYHYSNDGRHGYFLYEYLQEDADLKQKLFGPGEFGLGLARKAVDCLIQIANEFQFAFDSLDSCPGISRQFSEESVHDTIEYEFRRHPQADDRLRALHKLSEHWRAHTAWYKSLPAKFAHGDMHSENLIVSDDGRLGLVDWETYGLAPIGLDLVTLFESRLDHPLFETLIDRYFEGVGSTMGPQERRRTVAVLSLFLSVAKGRPLPRKWLHVLSDIGVGD